MKPSADAQPEFIPSDGPHADGDFGAAIYARTSSENQRFGYSIDEQLRRCWDRCEHLDWEVRFVFVDEAQSGRNTERPEFQQLLRTAEAGLIDVVIFWALDRFCRSLVDLVKTEERLDEYGVALHSVTEYIDTTTPVGRFNFRNLASAAELETDLTSKRVKMGMFGLAQDHIWPNDYPPLGYNRLEDGTLQVDESEAELVERIFRMYLRHESMPDVAFRLNEKGIRSKTGGEWSTQSVRKVLKNELYIGEYEVAGFGDYVDEYRIISDELFDEVKETRYRFQRDPMDKDRKEAIAEEIYDQFKEYSGAEN